MDKQILEKLAADAERGPAVSLGSGRKKNPNAKWGIASGYLGNSRLQRACNIGPLDEAIAFRQVQITRLVAIPNVIALTK